MKISKKTAIITSFCVGVVMLITTSFADVSTKTGYDQLKDAAKLTAGSLSKDIKSFTMDVSMSVKDNDKLLFSMNSKEMVDQVKSANQQETVTVFSNGEKDNNYSYRDSKSYIWYDQNSDTYYVTEYNDENVTGKMFINPFEEQYAKDMERIFDALVGNLKDYVAVEGNSDGSKTFSGSLSEAQIPALVNAVSSFGFKQMCAKKNMPSNEIVDIPELSEDVFVKKCSGKMSTNKEGIVENVLASAVLSGKDKAGNAHDITFEVLGKIVDINSTSVVKPDLTGKNVEKRTQDSPKQNKVSEAFVGKYANDIVVKNNNTFVKIGQRVLQISHVDDKTIAGKYFEEYKPGYEEYKNNGYEFTFDVKLKDQNFAEFEFENKAGKKENGSINFETETGKIYFNINGSYKGGKTYDSNFSKVFED